MKIMKIKALINEGFQITSEKNILNVLKNRLNYFHVAVNHQVSPAVSLHLNPESGMREVPDHFTGCLVANLEEKLGTCCKDALARLLKTPITKRLTSTSERSCCRSFCTSQNLTNWRLDH